MIKFEKIEPGMELLDIHRNTDALRSLGLWKIRIISVDKVKRTVMASWNGNAARMYTEDQITKYYTKPTKAYREQEERRKARP